MIKKYNIAIIGSGKMAVNHANVFSSFKNVNLDLVFSRTIENAKKFAKKFNIENYIDNLDEIKKYKLDGIIICVDVNSMFFVTRKIIPLKIPMLIEKPIALNFPQAEILSNLYKKYKTPNLIALNRRYYSIFHKVIKFVKIRDYKGFLIEGHEHILRLTKINKKTLDNWIFANSIHTINLITFFGMEKKFKSQVNTLNDKNDKNISSIFNFENKILGTYIANWFSSDRWSIKLFLKDFVIHIKPLEEVILLNKKNKKKKIFSSKEDKIFKPGLYKQSLSFLNLIKTKKNMWPDENLSSIIRTYKIINKLK